MKKSTQFVLVSTVATSVQKARDAAVAFLGSSNVSKIDTSRLLHDYWSAKSGLTPKQKYSVNDHRRAAGAANWLKGVV